MNNDLSAEELITRFPEGQYILRETIKNLDGDRRFKQDWRHTAYWYSGTAFYVIHEDIYGHGTPVPRIFKKNPHLSVQMNEVSRGFLDALERVSPRTFSEAVRADSDVIRNPQSAAKIVLDALIKEGRITLDEAMRVLKSEESR